MSVENKTETKDHPCTMEEVNELREQGLSYKEIQEKLNCTYGTVRARVKRYNTKGLSGARKNKPGYGSKQNLPADAPKCTACNYFPRAEGLRFLCLKCFRTHE